MDFVIVHRSAPHHVWGRSPHAAATSNPWHLLRCGISEAEKLGRIWYNPRSIPLATKKQIEKLETWKSWREHHRTTILESFSALLDGYFKSENHDWELGIMDVYDLQSTWAICCPQGENQKTLQNHMVHVHVPLKIVVINVGANPGFRTKTSCLTNYCKAAS